LVSYVRGKMNMQRSLDMVFLSIRIPKKDSKSDREIEGEQFAQSGFKEMSCEMMSQFFQSLSGLYDGGISGYFTDQD